jgi:mannosylfructose-phosphate synthase
LRNLTDIPIDFPKKHKTFLASNRQHILMITNHGLHQWKVIPGLPDTGGQNVYVNQLTQALAEAGFKITIVNRGGYIHPNTGEWREGVHYQDERQRLLYLQDSTNRFIRKEDMADRIPELVEYLEEFLADEGTAIDLIISHYWDGAKLGVLYNQNRPEPVKHIWVPHSLGAIKKRNVSEERWADLRIDERIETEHSLIETIDYFAATSATIRTSMQDDYGCPAEKILFLPPAIDTDRYHPRQVAEDDPIWDFLSGESALSAAEIKKRKIISEISRTDTTKRKDVVIKAFAQAHRDIPESLLVISIDNTEEDLAQELKELITSQGIEDHTAVVGYVWDILPTLYAVTDVYCTPSVMEGFGMSAQEAAATKVSVVASHLVPFVTEYLLDSKVKEVAYAENGNGEHHPLQQGRGAIVVQADEVDGFAQALKMLLTDDSLCQEMANNAYQITIPRFTWGKIVRDFLQTIGIEVES